MKNAKHLWKAIEWNGKTYRENEAITSLEHVAQKERSPPHHVDEVLGHVHFLPIYVILCLELVAVKPQKQASLECCLVDRHQ